jgi:hypothetical protein
VIQILCLISAFFLLFASVMMIYGVHTASWPIKINQFGNIILVVSLFVGPLDGHNVRINFDLIGLLHNVVGWGCSRLLVNVDNCRNVRSIFECKENKWEFNI